MVAVLVFMSTACGQGTAPEAALEATTAVTAAAPSEPPAETLPTVDTAGETETPDVDDSALPVHVEGHRGARGLKPENTLQAFETALDIGVSTLEFDLHLSADSQVIVWHDKTLGADKCRFADDVGSDTDFPEEGVPISSLTADQLGDYRCDLNPDPGRFPDQDNSATAIAGDNYQPVTLMAVFDFVETYAESSDKTPEQRERASVVEFNIETKRDPADPGAIGDDFDGVNPGRFELEVLAAVDSAGLGLRVVIQSFDHRSLWAVRSVDADIRLAALTVVEPPDLSAYASSGADIWSPNFNAISQELIDEAHAQGLVVIPWTVNDFDDMVGVLDQGADGLITDRPDIAASLSHPEG